MSMQRSTIHNVPCKVNGVDCTAMAWIEETELIRLDSMFPESDPRWRYLDRNGHMHRPAVAKDAVGHEYVTDYPTIDKVMEPPWWCDECNEMHSFVDHYVCKQCREQITPSTRPSTPTYIQGPRNAWAKVITFDGDLATGPNREDFVVEIQHKRYQATRGDVFMRSGEPLQITFHIIKPLENDDAP